MCSQTQGDDIEIVQEANGQNNANHSSDSTNRNQHSIPRKISNNVNEIALAGTNLDVQVNNSSNGTLVNSPSGSIDSNERQIIDWDDNDPENPHNFSSLMKCYIIIAGILIVTTSTMGSALPSNAIPYITAAFDMTDSIQDVLPISIFLAGYVVGPIFFGPLSETYGRKIVLVIPYFLFTLITMACALAPSWPALVVFRFFGGVFSSSPLSVVPGCYADIFDDPVTRGRAMALFMGATAFGPLLAPIISGFISPIRGWQWTFWIGLIIIGAYFPLLLLIPETYHPVLLTRRARQLRLRYSNPNIFSPQELEKKGWKQMATVTLTRPLRMLFTELIVAATSMYLSLAYSIFYINFTAYPLVFQGIYEMSSGISGLMFLPIAVGTTLAIGIFIWYDSFLLRAKAAHKPWTAKEEARRVPLAYLGGPLYVIALLWLGWSARPDIPWVVPFLSGVPFGIGFVLLFMALLNYVTDAYEIFAASAMAATSCSRSLAGTVLPFAAKPMYNRLGIAWGSSLLAFLSLAMCAIPFIFVAYGETIRSRSRFCMYLKERKESQIREAELRAEVKQLAMVSADKIE